MIEAVIFDLDGTVLDNEADWEEAFVKVISGNGIKINGKLRQVNGWLHEPGVGLETNWKRLIGGDVDEVRRWSNLTREEYRSMLGEGVRVREGLIELIEKIKEYEWRTALATSTYWYVAEEELEELALQLAFDVTTTGEEVTLPKPNPEIYLLTAQKLGVEPANCIVIEDSVGGVRSGAEAGMKVIGLVSEYAPEGLLKAAGAGRTVRELGDVVDTFPE
jgi:HAD superfamily hydrolase (TIGR01509 family)